MLEVSGDSKSFDEIKKDLNTMRFKDISSRFKGVPKQGITDSRGEDTRGYEEVVEGTRRRKASIRLETNIKIKHVDL